MKPKTLVLMILAIVCGLAASYMTSQLIASNSETVTVYKAKKRVGQWTTIRDARDMFVAEPILKKNAPQSTILADADPASKHWDDLKGRRLRTAVEEGSVLTEDLLLKKDSAGLDIPEGKRAMAVRISADSAVGFFVVPGSRVDVIQTLQGNATVVLRNRLVLAIDLLTVRPDDKVGVQGATATLQLDNEEQVLKLTTARDKGTISLAMRPQGDDGAKEADKEEEKGPAVASMPLPPPPPPPTFDEPAPAVPTPAAPVTEKTQYVAKHIDIINGSRGFRRTFKVDKAGNIVEFEDKTFEDINADRAEKAAAAKAAEKPPVEEKPAKPE